MKEFFRKNYREMLFFAVIIACAILILCTLVLLDGYSDELQAQARTRVELFTEDVTDKMSSHLKEYTAMAMTAAKLTETCTDRTQAEELLRELIATPRYRGARSLRFFSEGGIFDGYDNDLTDSESAGIRAFAGVTECRVSAPIYDVLEQQTFVAFYAPVESAGVIDGVALLFEVGTLKNFIADLDATAYGDAEFLCFCSSEGEVLGIISQRSTDTVSEHNNIRDVLRAKFHDKDLVDRICGAENPDGFLAESATVVTVPYVISVGTSGARYGDFRIIGLYEAEAAYPSGYRFVNTILGMLIVFLAVLICFGFYFLFNRRQISRRLEEIGAIDPKLGCPTQIRFERRSADLLAKNRATRFAIVVLQIKHYRYIYDTFGEKNGDLVLGYVRTVCEKSLLLDESFGYFGEGVFGLLYHYREPSALLNRLRSLRALCSKYNVLRLSNGSVFTVRLNFGIYEVDRSANLPVHTMIDCALEAKNAVLHAEDMDEFKFYNERIRESYRQNTDIEIHMEAALANKEFIVFYQPKYNIAKNRLDGCEALVRWFDPETQQYRPPALFMPLFEANGFVVRVDHYVYVSVCEYISSRVATGAPVCPVSVNVSRITAVQSGFIDFYVETKKKYGIADNLITIEFTESFAYENYDALFSIISELHENGFLCSIDDFGAGYSSYNILKELPMDEIKLDKFFIERGISPARDDRIIESVIRVAKALGLKVTQEGVEIKDDLDRLRRFGCDVIQGYYYSKPLSASDFAKFIADGGKM